MTVTIEQKWTRMVVHLNAEESRSWSVTASVLTKDTLNKGGSAGLLVLGPGFLYVRHLLPGPLMVLPCDFVPGRAVASPEAPY